VEHNKPTNDNQSIDVKSIFELILKNWHLFIISLVITLSIAFLFNRLAAPIYRVNSTLLFKHEDNRRMDQTEFLEGFQLLREELDFNNEILVLQSLPMLKDVVRKLNLNVSYFVKNDYIPKEIYFVMQEIYKSSPFLVIPDVNHPQPVGVKFFIQILNDEEFFIAIDEEEVDIYDFRNEEVIYIANKFTIFIVR